MVRGINPARRNDMELKYINFDGLGVVIFPRSENHNDMARRIGKDVLGAGFVSTSGKTDSGLECYGRSISLRIGSTLEDQKALDRACRA